MLFGAHQMFFDCSSNALQVLFRLSFEVIRLPQMPSEGSNESEEHVVESLIAQERSNDASKVPADRILRKSSQNSFFSARF
jgi:hypothetical protein